MPHPFNIIAKRTSGKTYSAELPDYPGVARANISGGFQPQRSTAQGMLLQYVAGTSSWYAEKVEDELKHAVKPITFALLPHAKYATIG